MLAEEDERKEDRLKPVLLDLQDDEGAVVGDGDAAGELLDVGEDVVGEGAGGESGISAEDAA